jgi:hypothetical protein
VYDSFKNVSIFSTRDLVCYFKITVFKLKINDVFEILSVLVGLLLWACIDITFV